MPTEVKQKSVSSSLEPCFFSSRFSQHAIKDAECLQNSYFGDKVFLSQCGEVEVSGIAVTWEGTALKRTQAQGLRRLAQADGAPVPSVVWLHGWPALASWHPGVKGKLNSCAVPGEKAVLSRHQQNNWEK